jgi:hypothetical protein
VSQPGPTQLGGYDFEALPDSAAAPEVDPEPAIAEIPSWPPRGWLLDGAGELHPSTPAPPRDVRRDAPMHELANTLLWSLSGFLVGFGTGALTARLGGGRRARR